MCLFSPSFVPEPLLLWPLDTLHVNPQWRGISATAAAYLPENHSILLLHRTIAPDCYNSIGRSHRAASKHR
jgi:hypothetical protein